MTPETARETPLPRRRILAADDESSMLLLLRVNLSLRGFDVVEARSGPAALELATRERFDLLLLDVMMPGLSGFQVAERLREQPATAAVPIVFVSARADQSDVEHGLRLGALDYITKPFDPLTLGDRLEALLERGEAG